MYVLSFPGGYSTVLSLTYVMIASLLLTHLTTQHYRADHGGSHVENHELWNYDEGGNGYRLMMWLGDEFGLDPLSLALIRYQKDGEEPFLSSRSLSYHFCGLSAVKKGGTETGASIGSSHEEANKVPMGCHLVGLPETPTGRKIYAGEVGTVSLASSSPRHYAHSKGRPLLENLVRKAPPWTSGSVSDPPSKSRVGNTSGGMGKVRPHALTTLLPRSYTTLAFLSIMAVGLLVYVAKPRRPHKSKRSTKGSQTLIEADMVNAKGQTGTSRGHRGLRSPPWFYNTAHWFYTLLATLLLQSLNKVLGLRTSLKGVGYSIRPAHKGNKQQLQLARAMLDLSYAEMDTLRLTKTPTDIAKLLIRVERAFKLFAKQEGIELTTSYGAISLLNIDRRKIRNILASLVAHALAFDDMGGKVHLSLGMGEKGIEIIVTNKYKCISQRNLESMFKEDHQTPRSDDLCHQGYGIGLVLSREFARMHGGTLIATNEEGGGSSFVLYLPKTLLCEPHGQPWGMEKEDLLEVSAQRRSVDEEGLNTKVLTLGDPWVGPGDTAKLKGHGHFIEITTDGKCALGKGDHQDVNKGIISCEEKWVEGIQSYVAENIGGRLLVANLADYANTSQSSLKRRLKRTTGLSPALFIRKIRLQRAAFLLKTDQYSTVKEVMYAVGFEDSSSFSRLFKSQFGKSPTAFFERSIG